MGLVGPVNKYTPRPSNQCLDTLHEHTDQPALPSRNQGSR